MEITLKQTFKEKFQAYTNISIHKDCTFVLQLYLWTSSTMSSGSETGEDKASAKKKMQ